MFRKLCLLLILIPLLLCGPAFAQIDIGVVLSPLLANAQVVYLSNFDFLNQGIAEFLFQISITNTDIPVNGRMEIEIMKLGVEEPIAFAESNNFILPSGVLIFNNIQISQPGGFTNFPPPYDAQFLKFSETEIEAPNNDFEQELFEGGVLPGGRYSFGVRFIVGLGVDEVIYTAPPEEITVVSSAYVFPIAPGREGDMTNPEVIFTDFPLFQFNTNLTDLLSLQFDPFTVKVYKVLPEIHLSPDDVLTSSPHLELVTDRTLFQYPQDGGGDGILAYQPLEPGTYLWQVLLTLQTTGGEDVIESPLYTFKVVDPSTLSENLAGQAAAAEVLRLLRYLIGERADEYANVLSDFRLTDIRIDGETVDISELLEVMNGYEDQVIKIDYIELLGSQN